MPRVLVNIQSNDGWSVHFIGPDNNTRVGPWLVLDTHHEVCAILRWGNISADEMTEHESSIRCLNTSSVGFELTGHQLAQLRERAKGWVVGYSGFSRITAIAPTSNITATVARPELK